MKGIVGNNASKDCVHAYLKGIQKHLKHYILIVIFPTVLYRYSVNCDA